MRTRARRPTKRRKCAGLVSGPLAAGRGDLERVALAQVGQLLRHALAQLERDAVGMVDEHAQAAAAENLGEQHLDVGLAERRAVVSISAWMGVIEICSFTQKKRACAHFRYC